MFAIFPDFCQIFLDVAQISPEFCSEVRSAENEYENGNSKKGKWVCRNFTILPEIKIPTRKVRKQIRTIHRLKMFLSVSYSFFMFKFLSSYSFSALLTSEET